MRPLVEAPTSHEHRRALLQLLAANNIVVQLTEPNFFASRETIWVSTEDYLKAKNIADSVEVRYVQKAKTATEFDWSEKYKGSYRKWLLARVSSFGTIAKLLLLIVTLSIFLWYPISYIIRSTF